MAVITNKPSYLLGDEGSGGTARNDAQQIVPASNNVTGVDLDEVLQRDAHLLLHGAGVVHVAADVEELGAAVPGTTKAGEPIGSSSKMSIVISLTIFDISMCWLLPADSGGHGHSLHVGDGGGAAEHTNISREGRLEARFT